MFPGARWFNPPPRSPGPWQEPGRGADRPDRCRPSGPNTIWSWPPGRRPGAQGFPESPGRFHRGVGLLEPWVRRTGLIGVFPLSGDGGASLHGLRLGRIIGFHQGMAQDREPVRFGRRRAGQSRWTRRRLVRRGRKISPLYIFRTRCLNWQLGGGEGSVAASCLTADDRASVDGRDAHAVAGRCIVRKSALPAFASTTERGLPRLLYHWRRQS